MTPEDRARAAVRAMQEAFSRPPTHHPDLRDCLEDAFDAAAAHIAAAIRDAEAEAALREQARCTRVARTVAAERLTRGRPVEAATADEINRRIQEPT